MEGQMMSNGPLPQGPSTMKAVYTIVERAPGKSFWTRVGVGFVNKDGSLNLRLDAIPTNGTLHVREWREFDGARDEARREAPRRQLPARDDLAPDSLI